MRSCIMVQIVTEVVQEVLPQLPQLAPTQVVMRVDFGSALAQALHLLHVGPASVLPQARARIALPDSTRGNQHGRDVHRML